MSGAFKNTIPLVKTVIFFQQFAVLPQYYRISHGIQMRSPNVMTSRGLKDCFHSRCVALNMFFIEGYIICLQHFVRRLSLYESRLFSIGGCSHAMMKMQGLLGLQINSSHAHSHELVRHTSTRSNLGTGDGSKLCGLICAYRLLDIIALLGGRISQASFFAPHPVDIGDKLIYVRTSIFSEFPVF